MDQTHNNEIIQNLRSIHERYQEVVFLLMQGKGTQVPLNLIDTDRHQTILSNVYEQHLTNPDRFLHVNLLYYDKFQNLVADTLAKFHGHTRKPIFNEANKDKRFKDIAWQENIFFDFIKQYYFMMSEWLESSVNQYELDNDSKKYLDFITRQFIDALSPSNSVFCNPEVLRESLNSRWHNIVRGLDNLLQDIKNTDKILNIQTSNKKEFQLGKNIAATPGKILFQNDLMQLICYEPKSYTYAVPLLMVPSWINKYYIFDLSKHNSMVSFLTENNFQVFMISWRNPERDLVHTNFEDYLQSGILESCRYILQLGYKMVNTVGYCIGGTALATSLAYMSVNKLNYVNSASFLATLLDFTHPGDIGVFINEKSISAIEATIESAGYLDGKYMANIFSMLRANDLIWSFFVNNYLLGKSPAPFDILYWNSDSTNLPAKAQSYYLRNMYLHNKLKQPGKLQILSSPIDLTKIKNDTFFLATIDDHIAPWHMVYASSKLLQCNKTFCLASSGHVAGVIHSPFTTKNYHYCNNNFSLDSESWLNESHKSVGSWWIAWKDWLIKRSNELMPSIEYAKLKFLEYSPGSYALMQN